MSIYVTPFRRFTLRLDGFTSLHADADRGRMTTKPFTMTGDELHMNASTSAGGFVRVEITDAQGTPVPGFSFSESEPFVGDFINTVVRWKSKSDLNAMIGKPIRLRLELLDADVFAIQFLPRKAIKE